MKKIMSYKLRYSGLNFSNFLNFLIKNNIEIFDVTKVDKKIAEFKIDNKNYKKLVKENKQYKVEIISYGGGKSILKSITNNIGVVVGLFVIIVSSLLFKKSEILIKVKTDDCAEIIENVLKNNDIKLNEMEVSDIENYILENTKEISLISVKKQGNVIIINAVKNEIKNEIFEPYRSPYNMIINHIELTSGTLCVGENSVVKKGDILVEAYTINSNGERVNVEPKAKINADVFFCGSETKMKKNSFYKILDEKKVYKNISFFKNRKYDILSPYNNYVSETHIIEITKQYFVPIYLTKTIFYKTEKITEEFDFEKNKNDCLEKSKQNAYTILPKNVTIQEEKQNISELADRYVFQTYLRATMEF